MRDIVFGFNHTGGGTVYKSVDFINVMMPDPLREYGPSSSIPSLMGRDVLAQLRFVFNSHPVLEDK